MVSSLLRGGVLHPGHRPGRRCLPPTRRAERPARAPPAPRAHRRRCRCPPPLSAVRRGRVAPPRAGPLRPAVPARGHARPAGPRTANKPARGPTAAAAPPPASPPADTPHTPDGVTSSPPAGACSSTRPKPWPSSTTLIDDQDWRADKRAAWTAILRQLVCAMDWDTGLVAALTAQRLGAAGARAPRTVSRVIAWARDIGLVVVVEHAASCRVPRHRPRPHPHLRPGHQHPTPPTPAGRCRARPGRIRAAHTGCG